MIFGGWQSTAALPSLIHPLQQRILRFVSRGRCIGMVDNEYQRIAFARSSQHITRDRAHIGQATRLDMRISGSSARREAPAHRAEVRLIIEPSLSIQTVLNGTSSRERALELFAIHGIWDTEENCGVLVYIELADHKVEIIADRAANRVIDEVEWREICQTMTAGFARKVYGESVIAAMEKLNVLLHARFPDDGSRPNQLSDQPIML